jgi:BirA family biotin operon repressor/biotin-[acetyl-CoA-carboxylase] ligase
MTDPYDIPRLTETLRARKTVLVYEPQVISTMEIGAATGLQSTVVLTDHQTGGRGRYSRTWEDTPGDSMLATFVKPVSPEAVERAGTLTVSQLCVLAVYLAIAKVAPAAAVKIRWPNDLTADDRKLGGVLLMEGERTDAGQSLLFGVGLNVHASTASDRYRATDLDACGANVSRSDLVLAIDAQIDALLPDVARLGDPAVWRHYDERWQAASALLGRTIRITDDVVTRGVVIGSPFGKNLQLRLGDGSIMEVTSYGHTAHLEIE